MGYLNYMERCWNPDCDVKLTAVELAQGSGYCMDCNAELLRRRRNLTRNERLQLLADSGCDTWEEARGER